MDLQKRKEQYLGHSSCDVLLVAQEARKVKNASKEVGKAVDLNDEIENSLGNEG